MAAGRSYVQSNASGHSRNHYGDVNGNTTNNETHNHFHGNSEGCDPTFAMKKALFLTDPRIDRATIVSAKGARVAGTCEWILRDEAFLAWDRNEYPMLWIRGGPGRGKTMLSVYLTEQFEEIAREDDRLRLLYYFCDHRDKRRNTALTVLRGILWQFVSQEPAAAETCIEHFETIERTCSTSDSVEALWLVFESMIANSQCGKIVIVIDGLDECDGPSVTAISTKFAAKAWTQDKFAAIIISRDIVRLRRLPLISLDPDHNTHISRDIELFVSTRVQEMWYLDGFNEGMELQLRNLLLEKAAGTFLWVGFAMIELLQQSTCSEVLEVAQMLPPGLPDIYNRMLLAINVRHRATAACIFKWIATAMRPLSLQEIAAVANVEPRAGLSLEQAVRDTIAACGPILAIMPISGIDADSGFLARTVDFVHHSAREYFQHLNVSEESQLAEFKVTKYTAHRDLVKACVECLEASGLHQARSTDIIEEYYDSLRPLALLDYSTVNWYRHAAEVHDEEANLWQSYEFFSPKSVAREHWIWMACPPGDRDALMTARALPIAAYLGISSWATHILKIYVPSIHERDKFSKNELTLRLEDLTKAPYYAVLAKQPALVQCLLERMDDFIKEDLVESLLHCACHAECVDLTVLRCLIDNGADVNHDVDGFTALDTLVEHQAAGVGGTTVAEAINLLKDHGAIAKAAMQTALAREAEQKSRWDESWSGRSRSHSSHSHRFASSFGSSDSLLSSLGGTGLSSRKRRKSSRSGPSPMLEEFLSTPELSVSLEAIEAAIAAHPPPRLTESRLQEMLSGSESERERYRTALSL